MGLVSLLWSGSVVGWVCCGVGGSVVKWICCGVGGSVVG